MGQWWVILAEAVAQALAARWQKERERKTGVKPIVSELETKQPSEPGTSKRSGTPADDTCE